MADSIVVCPGCAKRYQVPAGIVVPPGSTFACTVCTMAVPYGPMGDAAPAAAPARAGAAAAHGTPARRAAGGRAPARGRASAARMSATDDDAPPGTRAPQESSNNMMLIAGVSIIGLGLGVFLLVKMMPETRSPEWIAAEEKRAIEAAEAAKNPGEKTSKDPVSTPIRPRDPPPPCLSDSAYMRNALAKLDPDLLFRPIADVAGVTPEQRAAFDKDVALVVRKDAVADTADARARLIAAGRNSVPALLAVFTNQWGTGGWGTDEDKRTSYVVQQILLEISHRNRATDFPATYESATTHATTEEFDRVARVWVNWWNTQGKKFKEFDQ